VTRLPLQTGKTDGPAHSMHMSYRMQRGVDLGSRSGRNEVVWCGVVKRESWLEEAALRRTACAAHLMCFVQKIVFCVQISTTAAFLTRWPPPTSSTRAASRAARPPLQSSRNVPPYRTADAPRVHTSLIITLYLSLSSLELRRYIAMYSNIELQPRTSRKVSCPRGPLSRPAFPRVSNVKSVTPPPSSQARA
jgi:hypothetical protein